MTNCYKKTLREGVGYLAQLFKDPELFKPRHVAAGINNLQCVTADASEVVRARTEKREQIVEWQRARRLHLLHLDLAGAVGVLLAIVVLMEAYSH